MTKQIQILNASEISAEKWNACLATGANHLIYARYEYLNLLCNQWSGLVLGNYETILPLPWRKKWGIRYYYAPAFIQQLGLFGHLHNLPLDEIWKAIHSFAKFGDLFFNFQNHSCLPANGCTEKKNYVLDLNKSYQSIFAGYHPDLIQNLRKTSKLKMNYCIDLCVNQVCQLFENYYQSRFKQIKHTDFLHLQKACVQLASSGECITRTIESENQEILAAALLLKSQDRLVLLLNLTSEKGRSLSANHYLLDQIIQEFSEENLLLDFEGSEIAGIQQFYENFNPKNQPYFHVRINQLPNWINWFRILSNKAGIKKFR